MASWLNKASGLFQRSTAGGGSDQEPYQFVCECGARVAGLRESRFQQFPCEACSRVVFVLPVNVYPRPAPARKPVERTSSEEPEPEPARRPSADTDSNEFGETPLPPTRRKKSAPDIEGGVRPRRKPSEPQPKPPPRHSLEQPRRRNLTPFRMIAAGIGLLVLATGLGLGWRWRVEHARSTLPVALEQGLVAFGERNFVKAAQELGRAKAAVDILGKHDADADAVRHRWREARAANAMPYLILTDWLQECLAVPPDGKSSTARAAANRIKGAWLVLDVPVTYDAETQEPVADVMLPTGETLVDVDLPLPETFRRGAADERPTRVIVGAQVAQFRPPSAEATAGRLEFVPQSVFLWTDYETYRAVVFEISPEEEPVVRELIAAQSRWEEAGK